MRGENKQHSRCDEKYQRMDQRTLHRQSLGAGRALLMHDLGILRQKSLRQSATDQCCDEGQQRKREHECIERIADAELPGHGGVLHKRHSFGNHRQHRDDDEA